MVAGSRGDHDEDPLGGVDRVTEPGHENTWSMTFPNIRWVTDFVASHLIRIRFAWTSKAPWTIPEAGL